MPKKYRKMLTDWDAPYIQSIVAIVETQSKQTLANWCIDYAHEKLLPIYEAEYPGDFRTHNAIDAAREWLAGNIKLPQAKKIILECHAAAREADGTPAAQAAARAIGQCSSTIHSAGHCVGLPLYGSLAVAYGLAGSEAGWDLLEQFAIEECGRMEAALRTVAVENEPNPAKLTWKC